MVKHHVAHSAKNLALPVTFGNMMLSRFKFERDTNNPDLIWARFRWVAPLSLEESKAMQVWVDPFQARSRFLQAQNRDEILAFLNFLGVGWSHETEPVETPVKARKGFKRITIRHAQPIFVRDVEVFQEFTRQALTKLPSKWLRLPGGSYLNVEAIGCLETRLERIGGMLVLRFIPTTLSQAILGAVLADQLAGNKYRLCELPECRMPFRAGQRQPPKRFCSSRHRAIAAMRRYRRGSKYRGRQSARKSTKRGEPI